MVRARHRLGLELRVATNRSTCRTLLVSFFQYSLQTIYHLEQQEKCKKPVGISPSRTILVLHNHTVVINRIGRHSDLGRAEEEIPDCNGGYNDHA